MMHACFHGGGSGSKITKSIAVIRDLTKSMKAMTLKVKGGGERHSRARRRRRWGPTTEEEDTQGKDASSSASSSAKIAPAQPHEEEDHGGEKHEHCDKCLAEEVEEGEDAAAPADGSGSDGEWMAEPEPGVLMTLAPRGDGANYLRRIRFSEDHFPDACAAHEWWAYNYDRIVELYSLVVQSEHASHGEDDDDPAAPATPCQSEEDEHRQQDGELEYSASSCSASASASGCSNSNFSGPSSGSGSGSANKVDSPILGLVTEPNSCKRSPQAKHNKKTRQEQCH